VLERARRESGDLRRGRDDRRAAAPDGQPRARRPEARVVAGRAPHRLADRRARPAGRRVGDARRRRQEAPPRRRAEPRHRPGVVARRDAHRVASNRNGGFDLWTVAKAGGEPELLLDAPGAARAPAWSPDGTQVAYSEASGGATSIWILR